jgi:hypothetical protein
MDTLHQSCAMGPQSGARRVQTQPGCPSAAASTTAPRRRQPSAGAARRQARRSLRVRVGAPLLTLPAAAAAAVVMPCALRCAPACSTDSPCLECKRGVQQSRLHLQACKLPE